MAHTALCVPDVEAATRWYSERLGLTVLSPPYLMEGEAIERDMGELLPAPRLKAAILGMPGDGDRVLEVLEYPDAPVAPDSSASVVAPGFTHVGFVCDDLARTRRDLEQRGVKFLTRGVADVAGLRTTWLADPWGNVVILLEKRRPDRPYYAQH